MQAKQKNNFDLQKDETLRHCGTYIKVNGKENVRFYTLKGKLLLEEKKPSKSFHPFVEGCFILENGVNLKFLTPDGEEIITDRKLVKYDTLSFSSVRLVRFYDENGKTAIFNGKGECLLDFDNYKYVKIRKYIIIFSKNGIDVQVYDINSMKLIEGTYEQAISQCNGVYLKTQNGFGFYDYKTGKIEYCVDGFFNMSFIKKEKNGQKFWVYFRRLYKDNKCGLLAIGSYDDDYAQKLIFPFECSKIENNPDDDDEILIWTKEGLKSISKNSIYAKYFENLELGKEEIKEREKTTTIRLFDKFEVEEDDEVYFDGNYIVIYNYHERRHKQICYKTDGTLIGDVGIVSDDDGYEYPNVVATDNWIVIGDDCWSNMPSLVNRFAFCRIVGVKELEGMTFESFELKNGFYILSDKPDYEKEKRQNHFFAIFDKTGKLILTINKINDIVDISESYIEAFDTQKNLWFYDFKGNKIFNQWFDENNAKKIRDTVWVKIPEGYIVYDCLTGESQIVSIEEPECISYDKSIYCFSKNGLYGLYQYTSDRQSKTSIIGFREIVPIECEKIDNFYDEGIRAVKKDTEEIYDENGKLLAKTVI